MSDESLVQTNYGVGCGFETYSSVAVISGDAVLLLMETRAVFVTADACRDNSARGGNSNRPLLRLHSPRDYVNFGSH
jgi:hypothetical protein